MKTPGIKEIKDELLHLPANELLNLCLRLARFKKENKELLAYLLFDANNQDEYKAAIKVALEAECEGISLTSAYFARKSLRKLERKLNQYFKYVGSKEFEADLLIFYLDLVKKLPVWKQNRHVETKLVERLLVKINKVVDSFHPDLQYDFRSRL